VVEGGERERDERFVPENDPTRGFYDTREQNRAVLFRHYCAIESCAFREYEYNMTTISYD